MTINRKAPSARLSKLLSKRPVHVYKGARLRDLEDKEDIIQLAVPPIETGLEKEEENEHDLQAALSVAQNSVTTDTTIHPFIPVPSASNLIDTKEYSKLYKMDYKTPATNIRFSATVEETTGCPYTMDEVDDAYLKDNHAALSLSEDDFEKLVWEYESITDQKLPCLHLDVSLMPEYEDFLLLVPSDSVINSSTVAPLVYEHWKERRIKRGGRSIIPVLARGIVLNPYVCFQKRDTRPMRKTRRNNKDSIIQLFNLRSNMKAARHLLESVTQREKQQKEELQLRHQIFNMTRQAFGYQRALVIEEDKELDQILSNKKKRKASHAEAVSGSGTNISIPVSLLNRDLINKSYAENELRLKCEQDAFYEDITECSYEPFTQPLTNLFFQHLSSSPTNQPIVDLHYPILPSSRFRYRKRLGRAGRLFLDRMESTSSQSPEPPTLLIDKSDKDEMSWDHSATDGTLKYQETSWNPQGLYTLIPTPSMQQVKATMQKDQYQEHNRHHRQQQRKALAFKDANNSIDSLKKSGPTSVINTRSPVSITPHPLIAGFIANENILPQE